MTKLTVLITRVTAAQDKSLKRVSKRTGSSVAEIIRRAIDRFLAGQEAA